MMFVLSVGFLMAQGVFTYQAVVVDDQGNLVVNKSVSATVTITDDEGHTFEQSNLTGTTSANGLVVLSVGDKTSSDFNNMNWKNAEINVQYTVAEVTVPVDASPIPAVPYALQTNDELTTAMIVEYIKGASMDDVREILDAMDHGTPALKDTLIATFVDTVKANYKLAKEVFLDYIAQAVPADLDSLYKALASNASLTAALDTILVHFLKDSTEMVYDILRQYALNLTPNDVNAIIAAIPPTTGHPDNVKSYIVNKAFEYLMTENAKKKLFIPVVMDYVKNAETSDVDALVYAIDHNPNGVKAILVNKFNTWMDDYFANHYTGGSNNSFVQTLVNDSMNNRYYTCNAEVDLCQLKHDLDSIAAAACFTFTPSSMTVEFLSGSFEGTAQYTGPVDDIQQPIILKVSGNVGGTSFNNLTKEFTSSALNNVNHTISFTVTEEEVLNYINNDDILEIVSGDELNFTLTVGRDCDSNPAEISGSFTMP